MLKGNIEKITLSNNNYREVIHTNSKQQLVVMSLKPNEEIGMEKHSTTSQFFRIEYGTARAKVSDKIYNLKDGDFLMVPPNTYHNIWNTSSENDLKLYTIYSPPNHSPNTIQKYKNN